mmetsp:Transcript_14996/g.42562  ORF Transcript_14996/g.42562 Transcript_14996/m.42562 type:complete len:319 (+) Transcript_14996:2107-3063(+)
MALKASAALRAASARSRAPILSRNCVVSLRSVSSRASLSAACSCAASRSRTASSRSARNAASSKRAANKSSSTSTFTLAAFRTRFARTPKRRVETVSSACNDDAETHTSKAVLALPPNEDCNNLVSLESRYGTCVAVEDVNAAITLPRADKDELIRLASFSVPPVALVLATRSEPAKSTRRMIALAFIDGLVTLKEATKCDRELSAFISCDATTLLTRARSSNANVAGTSLTTASTAPSTTTDPSLRFSRSFSGRCSSFNKSRKSSYSSRHDTRTSSPAVNPAKRSFNRRGTTPASGPSKEQSGGPNMECVFPAPVWP